MAKLKAPFPYFGGKSRVADKVWRALGNPSRYIEPFFGSGAVLLSRPDFEPGTNEIVNDKDGFVCNVWRALQYAPGEVARFADWPVNHVDLMARLRHLSGREERLLIKLIANPKYYDAELAGYWIWCASSRIGGNAADSAAIPNIADTRRGVHAPRLQKAKAGERLTEFFAELQARLRDVNVVCGDWSQVCSGKWHLEFGDVGFFFDPPYGGKDRDTVYHKDSFKAARDVMIWCMEHGPHPGYRIVLCGYDEHEPLLRAGWTFEEWTANGGYANQGNGQGRKNKTRERIYYSPHCLRPTPGLFDV
jgi:DNA adenine methylase